MLRHLSLDGADSAAVERALSAECSLGRGCAGKVLFLANDSDASSAYSSYAVVGVAALVAVVVEGVLVDVALSS